MSMYMAKPLRSDKGECEAVHEKTLSVLFNTMSVQLEDPCGTRGHLLGGWFETEF